MCTFILPFFSFCLSGRQGGRVVVVVVVGCAQLRRRCGPQECHSATFSIELEHGAILRLRSETRRSIPPSVFSYGEHILLYETVSQKNPFYDERKLRNNNKDR
jgi:hypothetical protein